MGLEAVLLPQLYVDSWLFKESSVTDYLELLMTVFSPWQWFCSTRTFSNCLETTLTITALYFWPWKLSSDTVLGTGSDSQSTQEVESNQPGVFTTLKSVNRYAMYSFHELEKLIVIQSSNGSPPCRNSLHTTPHKSPNLVLCSYANTD